MRIAVLCAFIFSLSVPAWSFAEEETPRLELHTAPVALGAGLDAQLIYDVEAPLKVNAKAPRRVVIGTRVLRAKPGPAPVALRLLPGDARDERVQVETEYYVCEDRPDAPCYRRVVSFQVPVTSAAPSVAVLQLKTPLFGASAARP